MRIEIPLAAFLEFPGVLGYKGSTGRASPGRLPQGPPGRAGNQERTSLP
jgi:hypothetical protein